MIVSLGCESATDRSPSAVRSGDGIKVLGFLWICAVGFSLVSRILPLLRAHLNLRLTFFVARIPLNTFLLGVYFIYVPVFRPRSFFSFRRC
jgi:hypothetical protein